MIWAWALVSLLAAGAFYISLRGAPYVPTLKSEVIRAVDLAELRPGMTIVDLGSGDGRLLLAAVRRGCRAVGFELNPLLVTYSQLRTYRFRRQVSVSMRDFWRTPLPPETDAVFVFLASPFMERLQRHIQHESDRLQKPLALISFAFELPDKPPTSHDHAVFRYDFTPQA